MTNGELKKLYNIRKATCCNCGCGLEALMPLGTVFVLDVYGNYYCSDCNHIFEDGDERIYDEDIYEDEDDDYEIEV